MITMAEAVKALAESLATGEPAGPGAYYITATPGYEAADECTVYMVGYASADPEECDEDGDPTLFSRGPAGDVTCMGPAF